jgi:2OG-Fe(II) oxygenase superfamily
MYQLGGSNSKTRMKFIDLSVSEFHSLGAQKKEEYSSAEPFPSMYFDNFFNEGLLSEILAEFPDLSQNADIVHNNPHQVKLASKGEYRFGERTLEFMHFLNSQPFLEFLSLLTGINALLPDPYFEGGGAHQIMPGGHLKIHADFNKNIFTNLDRRLNVLIYLNKDWEESWGGHLEFWDQELTRPVKKILPIFNRMAIFTTTSNSYHGHPDPLKCPLARNRKSLALYYYTNGRPEEENAGFKAHRTIWKTRPNNQLPRTFKTGVRQLTPPILYRFIKRALK